MLTYGLIVSKQKDTEEVFDRLNEFGEEHINKLFKVQGEFNLLVEMKAKNPNRMVELLNKVKNLDGVIMLKTFPVMHKTREYNTLPKF